MNENYFVRVDRDDNPQLIRCSPARGYLTVAEAKEAKIQELRDERRFYYEQINGFMSDLEAAKETEKKVKRLKL